MHNWQKLLSRYLLEKRNCLLTSKSSITSLVVNQAKPDILISLLPLQKQSCRSAHSSSQFSHRRTNHVKRLKPKNSSKNPQYLQWHRQVRKQINCQICQTYFHSVPTLTDAQLARFTPSERAIAREAEKVIERDAAKSKKTNKLSSC